MSTPSIRRQLTAFLLIVLCVGAPALSFAAYWLMLTEINEVMDDSLKQAALLLADKDLRGAIASSGVTPVLSSTDAESKLTAIARRRDGSLLFASTPELALDFNPIPGMSVQEAKGERWNVFTVLQFDRIVQVAQPVSVRRDMAAESASQLLIPLCVVIILMGALLFGALRQGMRPLEIANRALARRGIDSLEPLALDGIPAELLPFVRTLNELLQRLERAVREQRGFLADAAHELRSPITALQLQAQILERSHDPRERAAASDELAAGVHRMRRLVEQLLSLSRSSADSPALDSFASLNLGELARSIVLRWIQRAERRCIDLGADVRDEARVQGDVTQLETLLNNLVENALRYTSAGGTVDVIARVDAGVPVLAVADDGPGIATGDMGRIFDRFYRGSASVGNAEQGSGLGLAIVKVIAQRHGAEVSLHPGLGGAGVEVRVSFRHERAAPPRA
ncbi:MAG TPA: ATP-binding protein [Burkholderiaceae bacterium]|jgi:signal transduction histidine kinase|nr:ATP-binding protein [Burkholderiaceae bacterium]